MEISAGNFTDIVCHFHYLGLFLLLILGGVGFPFPEDATLILTGVLIAAGTVKPLPALVVVYAGVVIADLVLYEAGRRFGRRVVEHRGFRRIISPKRFFDLESRFQRRGVLLIVAGRHLVGLRAQLMVVSGIMRMGRLKFLLADAFSAVFTIALMVGVGYKGGESIQVLKRGVARIEHVAAVTGVAALMVYLFYRYFKTARGKKEA